MKPKGPPPPDVQKLTPPNQAGSKTDLSLKGTRMPGRALPPQPRRSFFMIQTIPLSSGVTLRCFRDSRFKQGCLSFQLLRPMAPDEAAMNALLPSVLLRGTKQCPDLRSITQRLDSLYGAGISPIVRRVGDYQTTGLYCGFMDDRFALPGDRVLAPLVDFLQELLLDFPMEDEGFLPAFVDSEKRNLISVIESERNDKRIYAMSQLLKSMCQGDSFGLPRLGTPEQVEAITPQGLHRHYRKILRESPIEICYVGSASPQAVAQLLHELLSRLDRTPISLPSQSGFHPGPGSHLNQIMDVSQGKLCMGFYCPTPDSPQVFAAMQVLNTVFGGGMTSKLFQVVREQYSLCYSIGSGFYSTKGILTVSAGIDFDKEAQTRAEILRQLELCRQGQITLQELQAGKEAILSSLRAIHDSPGSIENYYSTTILSGFPLSPQDYMAAVEQVSVPDLAAGAQALTLHTTYFLKGDNP